MSDSENTQAPGVAQNTEDEGTLMQAETDALLEGVENSASAPDVESAETEGPNAAADASAPPKGLEFAPAGSVAADQPVVADVAEDTAPAAASDSFAEVNEAPDIGELAARAAEAAQTLIEERELEEAQRRQVEARVAAQSLPRAQPTTGSGGRRRKQDRVLIGLMVGNLFLMGLMIAVPGGNSADQVHRPPTVPQDPGSAGYPASGHQATGHQAASDPDHADAKAPDPFHAPLQEPDEILPNHEMYEAGQLQVTKGNYAKAVDLFEAYLKAHESLQAFQLQMVYSSLQYCMQRLGRRQEALVYMAKNENLRQVTALPDELWGAAKRAESDARGVDMRRYYARFLLQQDQLGKRWASQEKIATAYMKIGDSYRLDAERGEQMGEPRLKINRTLKKPTGKPKPPKPKPAETKGGGH